MGCLSILGSLGKSGRMLGIYSWNVELGHCIVRLLVGNYRLGILLPLDLSLLPRLPTPLVGSIWCCGKGQLALASCGPQLHPLG